MSVAIVTQPVWSATRLKTYLTCPRQFRYAYVDLIPSVPTSPLVFGRVLHEVLCFAQEHQMQDGKLPQVAEVLTHFDGLWEKALDEERPLFRATAPSAEQHVKIAHEVLRAFLSAHEGVVPPLAVELAFEVEAAGHRLCGIIDRVDEGENGLVIVDYKSGARKPTAAEVERELQFTVYAFAVQKVLGQRVEKVIHYRLRDGSLLSSPRGESDFKWLLDEVLPHVAQAVEEELFPARFGHWCNWCDFREVCQAQIEQERTNPEAHEPTQGGEGI